jgi:hypothetical protein
MKLSKLQQRAKLAATSAEEAKTRSSAASKALEQIRERLRKAKLDLKKAKKRAKQAKRDARRATSEAESAARSLTKAEKKARRKSKATPARTVAVAGERTAPPAAKRGKRLAPAPKLASPSGPVSGTAAPQPVENSSPDSPQLTVR